MNNNNTDNAIYDEKLSNDIKSLYNILNDIYKSNIKDYILYTNDIYNNYNPNDVNTYNFISKEDLDFILTIHSLEEDITDSIKNYFRDI